MVTWISKSDFGDSRDKSYIISCPGMYSLKSNITFDPKHNQMDAIVIKASGVVLDLNGKTLKQSKNSQYTQIKAIRVESGHENVTILGNYGKIQNFSQAGIYVEGGNKNIIIGNEKELTISGCGYGTPTALLDGVTPIVQAGIILGEMVFFAKFGFIQYHGLLNNVKLINVTSKENNVGIGLGEGSQYKFIHCNFSNNKETRLINPEIVNKGRFYVENSVVCYGLVYFSNPALDSPDLSSFGISDIFFTHCTFNENVADASNETMGIMPDGAYCDSFFIGANFRNLKIESCRFNSNEALIGATGKVNNTRGCVLSSGFSTVIENSEFCNNKGGSVVNGLNLTGLIAGIDFSGRDNYQSECTKIKNCTFANNRAFTNSKAEGGVDHIEVIGMSIRYPSGVIIVDCNVENNTSTLTENNKNLFAFADGIFIFSDQDYSTKFANNIEITNCKISRNRVKYGTVGKSSGIRIFDDLCENIVIKKCVITENWITIGDLNIVGDNLDYAIEGAGVDLFNELNKTGPSYVSVIDNVIKSNRHYGVYTNLDYTVIRNNEIQNHDIGIDLNSCSNYVTENKILHCSIFGVTDTNVPSTSYVANNEVFGQTSIDYSVTYAGGYTVPVTRGDISMTPAYFPPAKNIQGENSSIFSPCILPTQDLRYAKEIVDPMTYLNKLHLQKKNTIQFRKK